MLPIFKGLLTPTKILCATSLGLLIIFYYSQKTFQENKQTLQQHLQQYSSLMGKSPTPSQPNVEETQKTIDLLHAQIDRAQDHKHFFAPYPKTESALILELQEYKDQIHSKANLNNIELDKTSSLGFEDILKNGRIPHEHSIEDLFILKTIATQSMEMLIQSHPQKILACIPTLEKRPNNTTYSLLYLQFSGSTYTLRRFINQFTLHAIPMYVSDISVRSTPIDAKATHIINECTNIFDIKLEFPNQLLGLQSSS